MLKSPGQMAFSMLLGLSLSLGAAGCSRLQGAPGGPAPNTPQPTVTRVEPAPDSTPSTEKVLAQSDPPVRDPVEIARRLGILEHDATLEPPKPRTYALGDEVEFWVGDIASNEYRRATVTLEATSPHLYMWVERGYNVDQADLQASADFFEQQIYPVLHQAFGKEWSPGIDGDPHLYVFNGAVPGVGGYFYSADEIPTEVSPYSNQHEMFYVNLDSTQPGTSGYHSLLAHEFQHMIHWYNDRNEAGWVNEGLSELAMRLTGTPVSSLGAYLRSTDIQLNDWPETLSNLGPHYGGSYLLMEYLLDRFGDSFIHELVSDPLNGIPGVEDVLGGRGLSFDEVFRDWTVANLAYAAAADQTRYRYTAIDPPEPTFVDAVTTSPSNVSGSVEPFGVDYIQVQPGGQVQVDFSGQSEISLSNFASAPDDFMWWSSRGDNSDMTLTRHIDLTGVQTASLHASLWYSIEDGWDYAYVEASTDGGATWKILNGQRTRPLVKGSSALGPSYTGNSGGGTDPTWIDDVFSLDAYAGLPIEVRFEYVTDDSANLDGLWIRKLEVPEIQWSDEGDTAEGWDANGFVRVTNQLPQKYLVTAYVPGASTDVVPIPIDPAGHGSITLDAEQGFTLIVSASTRHTRQPAPYSIQIH